jgi:hypothetical protein
MLENKRPNAHCGNFICPDFHNSIYRNVKVYVLFTFQEFHVAYVFIKMANSPRPGVWVLEKSVDNGITYQPWQYFADTPGYAFMLYANIS